MPYSSVSGTWSAKPCSSLNQSGCCCAPFEIEEAGAEHVVADGTLRESRPRSIRASGLSAATILRAASRCLGVAVVDLVEHDRRRRIRSARPADRRACACRPSPSRLAAVGAGNRSRHSRSAGWRHRPRSPWCRAARRRTGCRRSRRGNRRSRRRAAARRCRSNSISR